MLIFGKCEGTFDEGEDSEADPGGAGPVGGVQAK